MKNGSFLKILALSTPLLFFVCTAEASQVIKLKIDGTIHSGTTAMIESALEKVKETKSEALLIELDTPGGMLDATRDIVKLFLNTNTPIIVYVSPSGARAGSAGTFITMAAHVAAMAPATNIGAAHPISATGGDPEKEGGKHLAQKIENDTVAWVETIAKQRGRNGEWAKKAVLDSASITEDMALKNNVVDFLAKDDKEVLEKSDGRTLQLHTEKKTLKTKGAEIVMFNADAFTKFKNWLANPTVMFLLIAIAGMGLYVEMSHPGMIFPAVAAVGAILLLLIANSVIPLSAVGVGLLVLGIALLVMEIYMTSFGLLAVAGLAAFVFGAFMLFDPAQTDLHVPRGLIFSVAGAIGTIAVLVGIAVSRMIGLKQTTGSEALAGQVAVVDEEIGPAKNGRIYLNGEYWAAAASENFAKGEKVRIERFESLKAHVRRA